MSAISVLQLRCKCTQNVSSKVDGSDHASKEISSGDFTL